MIFFAMLAIKVLRPLCEYFLFIQIEKIAISQPPVIDGERSVFCGWKKGQFTWQNLIINYELFLEYREEILIMRECLMLIRNLTKNEMTI